MFTYPLKSKEKDSKANEMKQIEVRSNKRKKKNEYNPQKNAV